MPKALKDLDEKMLERLRERLAKRVNVSFYSNKNHNRISEFVFSRTRKQLSSSTLRRVFQYHSPHAPTRSTLDLISESLGYLGWEDFVDRERQLNDFDLSQIIAAIQIGGISSHEEIRRQVGRFVDSPGFFSLMEAIVDAAISRNDLVFLGQLFELPDVFVFRQDSLKIYFFIHSLVVKLNRSGLMAELIPSYGASEKAREFLVEWYVDEDHLDGYYHDLLQEYHRHKTDLESQLFYNCLMYQRAVGRGESPSQWLVPIREFVETEPVHPIPKARRLAILMLEADAGRSLSIVLQKELQNFFGGLNEDDAVIAVLLMVRLLFSKRPSVLIGGILGYLPKTGKNEWDIWTQINLNQLKIYQAYALLTAGGVQDASMLLEEFEPFLVNNFIRKTILNDYHAVLQLLTSN